MIAFQMSQLWRWIAIATLTTALAQPGASEAERQATDANPRLELDQIDWQAFMRQHDMTFDRLPQNWTEAPHFGNAMVGSMLYQRLPESLAAANIIQDMLLQSWSDPAKEEAGPIRIFPAVPSAWKDAEFHDLRAEGAFLVSAKRSNGRTQWIRIKSLAGEPCRVRPGIDGEIRTTGKRPFLLQSVAPGIFQIDLRQGEEVWLHGSTLTSPPP